MFSRSYRFGTKPLPPKPTAIVLGLVGLVLLTAAGWFSKSIYELEQTGIRVQGEVVKLERSGSTYFPVFNYRDNKGREFTVRSSTSSKSYLVGDPIPVLYDPRNPLDARVDEPVMLYLLPGILGILGALFILGMFLVWKLLPFFEKAYDAQRKEHDDKLS